MKISKYIVEFRVTSMGVLKACYSYVEEQSTTETLL